MIRSERTDNDDEAIDMEEIHDEVSKPLTFIDADAVPSVHRTRADSLSKINNRSDAQSDSGLRVDDDRLGLDKPIGFAAEDALLNSRLRPGFSFNDLGSRDLFPQPQPSTQVTPDVNVYQQKKIVAQGMMDLALLSANANQMRYVLQTDGRHSYFYPALVMISLSLFLQIAVGIGLIWNSRYNVKEHEEMCKANRANNWTVIGIFLVTILNVFISSFGVVDQVATTTAVAPLTT